MAEVKRAARVAGRIRQELALALRSLADPRLAGALVTRVEVTDDLQLAKVYVRLQQGGEAAARKGLLDGLAAAGGRIRRVVVRAVGLRVAPNLRFFYDEGLDASDRIESILREIHDEQPAEAPSDDPRKRD